MRRCPIPLIALPLPDLPVSAASQGLEINEGLSGTCFNPATPGQGFLTHPPEGTVFDPPLEAIVSP